MRDSADYLKSIFEKYEYSKGYRFEFYNSYHIIENLENKIKTQILQINPLSLSTSKRSRRGLIDGLGSIIKSITGNLDSDDAKRYDSAIQNLISNQKSMKTGVKEQISLVQQTIKTFNGSIFKLSQNQKIIATRIRQLENYVKTTQMTDVDNYHLLILQIVISQIITEYQTIIQILEDLENAITFSKLNVMHNSIINTNVLLNELLQVQHHLSDQHKLPFEVQLENILLFEKVISVELH